MIGFFNSSGTFSLAASQALQNNAYAKYIASGPEPEWNEVTLSLQQLNDYDMTTLTDQTKFIIRNESNYTSSVTIEETQYPIWITAQNPLEVHMRDALKINPNADDVKIQGFLFDGLNSRMESRGDRTHVTRCKFDGTNGCGGRADRGDGNPDWFRWIIFQSTSVYPDNPELWTGKDGEVSYCEFYNWIPTYALSSVFMFSYRDGHVYNHSIHHNWFHEFPNYANGSEPISFYGSANPTDWNGADSANQIVHTSKVYNNLFEDCKSDGEITKSTINGTLYYDNTIKRGRGVLSFRKARECKSYNNYIDGEGIDAQLGLVAFSSPDCEAYGNIAVGINSAQYPILFRFADDGGSYLGGYRFNYHDNFIEGGGPSQFYFGITVAPYDGVTKADGTMVDNVFVQADATQVLKFWNDFDASDISTSSGNTWYGTDVGEPSVGGFTQTTIPPFHRKYHPLAPKNVGVWAELDYAIDTSATMATLASKVAAITQPTKFILPNETYSSSLTINNNQFPVHIVAQNLLGVVMQRPMYIKSKDVIVEGFLWNGWTADASNTHGIEFEQSGCKITRCRFDNYKGRRWIETGINCHEMEISYCEFWNMGTDVMNAGGSVAQCILSYCDRDGTVSTVPQNTWIHHNHFKDIPDGNQQSVMVYYNEYSAENPLPNKASNTTGSVHNYSLFEYNLFENVGQCTSFKQSGATQRYNTLINCKSNLVQRHGSSGEVYGNTIITDWADALGISVNAPRHKIYNNFIHFNGISNPYTGILFRAQAADDDYDVLDGTRVGFNTIIGAYDSGALLMAGSEETVPSQDLIISNNILIPRTGGLAAYNGWSAAMDLTNITFQNNIYQVNEGNCGTIGTNANPQLTAQSDGRYSPTTGSYCLAKANTDMDYVTTDIYEQTRPTFRAIGASEIATLNNNPVVTTSDVGIDA